MAQKLESNSLQNPVQKVLKLHFWLIIAYALSIVIFDTWNLITHEGIAQRWTLVGILFIVNIVAWYLSRVSFKTSAFYKILIIALVVADIVFTSVNVYWERGMASRYVAVYGVAIVLSAVLKSRRAVLGTAMLCTAGYVMATTRYFYEHYGEGLKVQLYGTLFFYSAVFFIITLLLSNVMSSKD